MAIVAVVILAVLIFLLTGSGSLFESTATLKTFMQDSAAMSEASPVRLNGILIGEISRIVFTGSNEPGKVVDKKQNKSWSWKEACARLGMDTAKGVGVWTFEESTKPENKGLSDLSLREKFVLVPLVLLMIVLGVYPVYFTRQSQPSLDAVVRQGTWGGSASAKPAGD